MGGARGAADALIHQRAAQVVAAGVEAGGDALVAHFHPTRLDVGDVRVQGEAGDGVHQHGFAEGGAFAGPALQVHRCLHVHEGQGHELGEAAGPGLQVTHSDQVPRPVLRPFHMAVHDGGRGPESNAVGSLHHLQPLAGVDLVRTDDGADLIVENFRRSARQRAEARRLEPLQIGGQVQVQGGGALPNLQGRKGVDVHVRHRRLHRAQDADVGLAGVFGMDAALHAHFRAAPAPSLLGAPLNLLMGEVVGPAAQVLRQLALGEGAELAFEVADVGVVDVAVDDEAHGVAVDLGAQAVGGLNHCGEVAVARLKQPHDLSLRKPLGGRRLVQNGR